MEIQNKADVMQQQMHNYPSPQILNVGMDKGKTRLTCATVGNGHYGPERPRATAFEAETEVHLRIMQTLFSDVPGVGSPSLLNIQLTLNSYIIKYNQLLYLNQAATQTHFSTK